MGSWIDIRRAVKRRLWTKECAMTAYKYLAAAQRGSKVFAGDVAEGFFEITHNSLALVGVAAVLVTAALLVRPDLRQRGEEHLSTWLMARQSATAEPDLVPEPAAVERATAADPRDLPHAQANVASWIARKYRVGLEPVAALVAEAYEAGRSHGIDPTLVLAVMAVESRFNPFAQSSVGAQGLMQVMTHIHSEKYKPFGGQYAAFDPKTNLRVGVKVLQEYIARAGSVEAGLKWYVGAAKLPNDGGYVDKVLAEHARLIQVAKGRQVPTTGNASAVSASTPTGNGGASVQMSPKLMTASRAPVRSASTQVANGVPTPSANKPLANRASAADTDTPVANRAPAADTDTPVANRAPAADADTPVAESAPAADADTPVAESAPAPGADTSVVESASVVDAEETSTAESAPATDADTPVAESAPAAEASTPIASAPAAIPGMPVVESAPAVDFGAPAAVDVPAVDTGTPIVDGVLPALNADTPANGPAKLVALSK
jgi:soluble lytic murein transglycosylase-like protein